MRAFIALLSLAASPAIAEGWYLILDWHAPSCVESAGPILNGPTADTYEYVPAADQDVIIAKTKSTGKIARVYFLGIGACKAHAEKYTKIWAAERAERPATDEDTRQARN